MSSVSSSSSSSSSLNVTTTNGVTTISGLASGIDTTSLVDSLVEAQSTKLTKMEQSQQKLEWTQDAYRDIISDITTFSDTYFSLTSSSSLLLTSNYLKYAATSDNSAVTVSATSKASAGSHTVEVSQLATATTRSSASSGITKSVQGGTTTTSPTFTSGQSFVLTVDGTATTVTLTSSTTDASSLQTLINQSLSGSDSGKIEVTTGTDGQLVFSAASGSGVQAISISAPTDSSATSALSALGFADDDAVTSNRLSTSSTLAEVAASLNDTYTFSFNDDNQLNFTINGESFTFDSTETTLSEMISEINDSDAGVTMSYDSLNDKLVLTASTTGAAQSITASDVTETSGTSSNFITKLLGTETRGKDAQVTIDDVYMTRSSNSITLDGVTYKLNNTTTSEATVSVSQDTDAIYDTLSNFVDAYNTLIATINDKLDEDYDTDYQPLTDTQQEDMSSEEITKWEAKAKTGLLEHDSLLTSFTAELRTALISSVSGVTSSLASIGITSGTYDENGKLYIDEDTLKSAIETDAASVTSLFTKQSSTNSGTTIVRSLSSSELTARKKEEGIAYKLYDILQKYVSTTVDDAGNEGLLLEKAGLSSDSGTSTDNYLTDAIDDYQDRIDKENDRLELLRTQWTNKFTIMETYISKMNSQLSYISSLTSSS